MSRRTFYTLLIAVAAALLLVLGGRSIRMGFAALSLLLRVGAGLIFVALVLLGLLVLLRRGRKDGGRRDE